MALSVTASPAGVNNPTDQIVIIKHVHPRFSSSASNQCSLPETDVHRNCRIGATKGIAPENLAIVVEARHYVRKLEAEVWSITP